MSDDLNGPVVGQRRSRKEVSLPAVGVLGGSGAWSVAGLLRAAGIEIADVEPAPKQISDTLAARYHYGLASARTGGLGDVRQILQLVQSVAGLRQPKNWIWARADGSFIDALRPEVDPHGFDSKPQLEAYRNAHTAALVKLLKGVSTLVLPLARTAALIDAADGTVYPAAAKDAKLPRGCKPSLHHYTPEEIDADFTVLHSVLTTLRPGLKLVLTVAPQTVSAEPGDLQDLMAQSTLSALATRWAARHEGVAYSPILDHLLERQAQSGADSRLGEAIRHLMASGDILDALATPTAAPALPSDDGIAIAATETPRDRKRRREARRRDRGSSEANVMCEDELLEAFS